MPLEDKHTFRRLLTPTPRGLPLPQQPPPRTQDAGPHARRGRRPDLASTLDVWEPAADGFSHDVACVRAVSSTGGNVVVLALTFTGLLCFGGYGPMIWAEFSKGARAPLHQRGGAAVVPAPLLGEAPRLRGAAVEPAPLFDETSGVALNESAQRLLDMEASGGRVGPAEDSRGHTQRAVRLPQEDASRPDLGGSGGSGGGPGRHDATAEGIDAEHGEGAGEGAGPLDEVPTVAIAQGTWKYVQMLVSAPDGQTKLVVRSTEGLRYHAEMYRAAMRELKRLSPSLKARVVGGGRIVFDPAAGVVRIFGYSKTFGRCKGCNEKSAEILRRHPLFQGYAVTWSDDGY